MTCGCSADRLEILGLIYFPKKNQIRQMLILPFTMRRCQYSPTRVSHTHGNIAGSISGREINFFF